MINQFSSIFEIFTGLNLAYAGSKIFRDAVDNSILQIGNTISTNHKAKISKIQSEITVTIAEEFEKTMQDKCATTNRYFTVNVEKIKKSEKHNSNFPIGIKSIFLLASLFCFTMLLIGGYEQFYDDTKTNQFLCFLNLISISIIFVFFRNLKPTKFNKNIKPLISISIFLIPIILYVLFLVFFPDSIKSKLYLPEIRVNVLISIAIALSAFLFHFLRVYIHRTYFRYQLLKIYKKTERELREFEKSIYTIKSTKANRKKIKQNWSLFENFTIFFMALKKDS